MYGGGNEGKVLQNTFVIVKDSTLNSNLYAGGNGANAIVSQNTNLLMHGTKNNVKNSVFGGGNKRIWWCKHFSSIWCYKYKYW